jgi:hypothetical protein
VTPNIEIESRTLLGFVQRFIINNSCLIERVEIIVDTTEQLVAYQETSKEFPILLSSTRDMNQQLDSLEPAKLETHLGPTKMCNWGMLSVASFGCVMLMLPDMK